MEILNGALKKYMSLSVMEILLFFISGIAILYFLKISTLLSSLNNFTQQKDLSSFPNNLFFLLFWFLAFIIGKRFAQHLFIFIFSFQSYNFKSDDWPRKWTYQGNIRLWEAENNALYVTDSNSGCILNNHYWKNLEIRFDCKFPAGSDDQTIGIIFRAKSLSDYLMIQINNKEKQIVPHIRMEGRWETNRQPTYNLTFEENVYFKVKLKAMNESVELFINGNKQLDWNIPTNSDLSSVDPQKPYFDTIIPKIDFRKSYGKVGFRAYQGENGIVKNLKIKRIPSLL